MHKTDEIVNKINNLNSLIDRKIHNLTEILNITKTQNILFKSVYRHSIKTTEDNTKTEKQNLIDEILSIDEMFLAIFESFTGELNKNKQSFKSDIKILQNKIQTVTEIDIQIRLQEEKNKQMLKNKQMYDINK